MGQGGNTCAPNKLALGDTELCKQNKWPKGEGASLRQIMHHPNKYWRCAKATRLNAGEKWMQIQVLVTIA